MVEEVRFPVRLVTSGSRYKATEDGLHHKPVPLQLDRTMRPSFCAIPRAIRYSPFGVEQRKG